MGDFGFLIILLLSSVTGLSNKKRILMSDPAYTHGLEVKVQELTAEVETMSANEHNLESKLQELTANITKVQSQAAAENPNLKQTVQELTANITKLQSKSTAPRSCPDGYIKISHSCYRIHHDEMTWTEAATFCGIFGAHLVIENTLAEHNDLKQKVTELQGSYKGNCYWIGASDANFEGHWEWIDSTQTTSSISWNPGEPNQGVTANCACLYKTVHYAVVTEPCGTKYNFICEIELEA